MVSPRQETRAVTVYICDNCAKVLQPATREHLTATAAEIAGVIANAIPKKE